MKSSCSSCSSFLTLDAHDLSPVLLFVTCQVMNAVQRVSLLNLLNDAEQDCQDDNQVWALGQRMEDQ